MAVSEFPALSSNSPAGASSPLRPLAVFDLDGTLLRGDSFLPFVSQFCWRKGKWLALTLFGWNLLLLACRVLSAREAKERVLGVTVAGERLAELEQFAADFCRGWVGLHLHPVGIAKLREHQHLGHRVLLLSASPDVYVPAIAKYLGISEVICTQVVAWDGHCTGIIDGANCKGDAKLEMLHRHLAKTEVPLDTFAYADHKSDLPVLRWARCGFWVTRREINPVTL